MIHFLDILQRFGKAGAKQSVLNSAAAQLLDNQYRPVSAKWMRDNWQAWVESLPTPLIEGSRPLWIKEAFDCDNHAFACMVHGTVGNALTAVASPSRAPMGLAKGVMAYTGASHVIGRHALCWWVNHQRLLHFFEPASGSEVNLSRKEIATTTFICAI